MGKELLNMLKRVAFAVGLVFAIELLVVRTTGDYDFWFDVLLGMPAVIYGLAIASRFWLYPGDKNDTGRYR